MAIPLRPALRNAPKSKIPNPKSKIVPPPPAAPCLPTPSRCLTNPRSKIADLKSVSLLNVACAASDGGSHRMIPRGGMPWVRKECEKPLLVLAAGCGSHVTPHPVPLSGTTLSPGERDVRVRGWSGCGRDKSLPFRRGLKPAWRHSAPRANALRQPATIPAGRCGMREHFSPPC
jgi:hypothetical protein